MNKHIILLILLLATILLAFIGCQNDTVKEAELQKVTNVFRSNFITLPENFYVNGSTITVNSDGRISVMCTEVLDMETYETATLIYSFDMNGENIETEYLELEGFEKTENVATMLNNYLESSEGHKIYYINQYFMDTQASARYFNIYDADGTLISSVDPKQYFNTMPDTSRYGGMNSDFDYFSINHVKISADDIIYMSSENAVVAVSITGDKLYEIEIGNGYIDKLVTTQDGKVIISYTDYNVYNSITCYIDTVKKALGEKLEVPDNMSRSHSIYIGAGYDLYFNDRVNVYGYNIGEEPVALMNMVNSDLMPDSMNDLFIIDENTFIYNGYDYLSSKQQFSILTRIPDDEVVPKKLINMAFLYIDTYFMSPHIINFNRSNDEYRIVMTDYSLYNSEDDWEAGRTKFNNDILSANIPDIMVFDANMTINKYLEKGLFTDLYQFMDNDPDFDINNLMQCVKNAYETDGKLYQIPTTVEISTLVGRTSIVDEKEGWTIDEVMALLEKYPDSYLTLNANKEYIMNFMMTMGINDFVDYETATCSFDSEEFIKLLNYANSFPEKSYWDNMSDDVRMDYWRNQKKDYDDGTFLLQEAYIYSFDSILNNKVSFNNDPITYKGYPSASGNGALLSSNQIFAISDKSLLKDGAWEFLKVLLSDDVLGSERMRHSGFPVTYSGFDIVAEDTKKYHYYMEENMTSMSEQPMENQPGVHMQITDEDITFLRSYLNNITVKRDYTNKIYEIILDDIQMFLAGEKSAEETAKVVQSRASVYISENS